MQRIIFFIEGVIVVIRYTVVHMHANTIHIWYTASKIFVFFNFISFNEFLFVRSYNRSKA